MEEKLKSALEPIHWSLLLRSLVVLAAWYFLSPLTTTLVLVVVYFTPLYRSGAFLPALLVLTFAVFSVEPDLLRMFILGGAIYLLLGVKNLVVVDRASAYQALVILLFFFLWSQFFLMVKGAYSGIMFLSLVFIALLFYFFSWRTLNLKETNFYPIHYKLVLCLGSFLIFQWGLVLMILPWPTYAKIATALLGTGLTLEVTTQRFYQQLEDRSLALYFSLLFISIAALIVLF
ncbi:MAG: hypothetical protein KGZ30_02785 [Anaplasmataceae bacterium]|nr:hypothetical protein [Anaplasmataceae bacterium]